MTPDAGELVVEVLCNITASLESELEAPMIFVSPLICTDMHQSMILTSSNVENL